MSDTRIPDYPPMTYAAALAILKAPRFADPESIRARDIMRIFTRVVELLGMFSDCQSCSGNGCADCKGRGVDTDHDGEAHALASELLDRWDDLPPDARQEALRRARTNRQAQSGGTRP